MTDTMLLRALSALLKKDASNLFCLIHYGSHKRDADLDLLLLTRGPTTWNTCSFGRLDLAAMQFDHFACLASMLDPMAIEPLLTGEVICGDRRQVKRLRARVVVSKPADTTVRYLSGRAQEELLAAQSFVKRYETEKESSFLLWALINLGYAFSYRLMSQHYASQPWRGPLTITRLIELKTSLEFSSLWATIRRAKKYPSRLKVRTLQHYLNRWAVAFLPKKEKRERGGSLSLQNVT